MTITFLKIVLTSPITWIFLVFGFIVGSFLNVCIYRIPKKIFFSKARSFCPHCQKPIAWYDNIPLISYLILRGKSRCCGQKISAQYPLVEFFTGLLFVLLYWKFPFVSQLFVFFRIEEPQLVRFLYAVFFSCILLVCSVIDLHHMIIPDVLSIPMILLTPLAVWIHPDHDARSAWIGLLIGGGLLYGIAWLYWLIRKEYGMGMGDVKLLAAIGGWLGYQSIFPTVMIASICGSLVGIFMIVCYGKKSSKSQIPFGPFLSAGAFAYLLLGRKIVEIFF